MTSSKLDTDPETAPSAGPSPGMLEAIERFGCKDRHIDTEKLPWVKYVAEGMYFKPIRFDTANNRVDIILDVRHPSVLGRHQHHGEVIAYTLEGSWYYKEYDWVAKPGDRVHEAPGGIHTLVASGEKGMKTLFHVVGPIDFFGDDGSFGGQQTVFWWINEYVQHCKANNIEVEQKLFY